MRRTVLLTASLLALVALGGCYERTVKARGVGAMGKSLEPSYRSDTAADRWVDSLFGDPRESKPAPKNPGVAMPR
jgi:hypothetical protein